jgi:hypothetical protein
MDQKTKDLVKEANKFISQLTIKNHIVYQVRTHIDRVCATGEGVEVLEHFVNFYSTNKEKYSRDRHNKKLLRLYYFNNMIIDANQIQYEYYHKANRHNEWTKVKKITHNNRPNYKN